MVRLQRTLRPITPRRGDGAFATHPTTNHPRRGDGGFATHPTTNHPRRGDGAFATHPTTNHPPSPRGWWVCNAPYDQSPPRPPAGMVRLQRTLRPIIPRRGDGGFATHPTTNHPQPRGWWRLQRTLRPITPRRGDGGFATHPTTNHPPPRGWCVCNAPYDQSPRRGDGAFATHPTTNHPRRGDGGLQHLRPITPLRSLIAVGRGRLPRASRQTKKPASMVAAPPR